MTLTTPTSGQFVITRLILIGQPVHKNFWRFYLQPFQKNLRGVKFWNGSRDPGHASFRDGRCPKANTWYSLQAHKIWWLASAIPEIFGGCQILECVTWPWPCPLKGLFKFVIWRLVLLVAKPCTKFEDLISGVRPVFISRSVLERSQVSVCSGYDLFHVG